MFMKQDWLMRQIEIVAVAIARLVFGKGKVQHDLKEEEKNRQGEPPHRELWELLARHELGTAEDKLFEFLSPEEEGRLAVAIEFYRKANAFSDEDLAIQGFTRDELLDGLHDAMRIYGVEIPGF